MSLGLIEQLDVDDRALVTGLLTCIVDRPEVYRNEVRHFSIDGQTTYVVVTRADVSGNESCRLVHASNIAPYLASLGVVVQADPPPPHVNRRTGRSISKSSQAFKFTPQAIQNHSDINRLPDNEVQRLIGERLYLIWRQQSDRRNSTEHDFDEFSRRLGVTRQRLMENARVLCELGYATQGKHAENSLENGNLDLTSPKGVQWANAGCPPIGVDGAPVVNVTVKVTLQQVFQEVRRLDISEEDKEQFELLLRRFEEETRRTQPSYKPLQDLLDMATKVRELAPVLFRFGADHIDDIGRMAQHLPGA